MVKQHLKDLHSSYVIAKIDKTTGNILFVCQHFYALPPVEKFELLSNNDNNNLTNKFQISNF